tara:strand:- start:553 stop:1107 length:555 start_codon:yes stop_codon:yes gene_type:complete
MSLKTLIIHQNKILYNILVEISENMNFKVIYTDNFELNFKEFGSYIVITKKNFLEIKNQLILEDLPLKLDKLIETINIAFLKQEYNVKSSINIGKYELNLNSRVLSLTEKKLDLTEMEANIILFLKKSEKPSSVKKLQKNVWGHASNLETHTVETHIYRLRKKIKDKFQDDNFIKSFKDGYQIS